MKMICWRYQARIVFTITGQLCTKINFTGKWPKIQIRAIWGLIIICLNFVQFWNFARKNFIGLNGYVFWFFLFHLRPHPAKKIFGPPPKKLVEKPFLGHFWLKIGYSCPDNFEKPRWKFLSWHLVIFWRNFPKGAKTFQRDWIWMCRSFQSKR